MKTTDRSLSNSSNSFNTRGAQARPFLQEGALVPLFTPRQTGKKLVSTPLEDKYIQTKTNKNHIVAFIFNKQTIYSQTARSPHPTVQFFSFTLGSPRWQALASFQFKVEVLRKTESRKPPYGSGPDDRSEEHQSELQSHS